MIGLGCVGLRVRVYAILAGIVVVVLVGGSIMAWYTHRMSDLFIGVIESDLVALEAAEDLELALVKQRGFLSYFFISGDPNWLVFLEEHRREFNGQIARTRDTAHSEVAKDLLSRIESQYSQYVQIKDQVIALYKVGEREEGSVLHNEVRKRFSDILDLCDQLKETHRSTIAVTWRESQDQAEWHKSIAIATILVSAVLAVALAFVLMTQILDPIRNLTNKASTTDEARKFGNEVVELSERVHGLIKDTDHTRIELERSRRRLLQSEKMAVIGKLAADVAHSIRNPMTSIKMRLYSLGRGLDLTLAQRDDFEVVSEEMRRLDHIVHNFLEFSRPHRLKMQRLDVSEIVDMTLHLLQRQLELANVQVKRVRHSDLPEIVADSELLKEVFVNLLVNACEAMKEGGTLTVSEEGTVSEEMGDAVSIEIRDTGPGLPEDLQEKVFEPFFSTKEEGTGLGLSIAARIVEEHRGRLVVRSKQGEGTTFLVFLPVPFTSARETAS